MELSERLINTLENQGFTSVFEWQDASGVVRGTKQHQNKVTLCVADGSLIIECVGVITELKPGQCFNIPPLVPYMVTAGEAGSIYIVGEMQEDYL